MNLLNKVESAIFYEDFLFIILSIYKYNLRDCLVTLAALANSCHHMVNFGK